MSPISDDELRDQLARRSQPSLALAERETVLTTASAARPRPKFSFPPLLWPAAVAAAVVLAVAAVPLLLSVTAGPRPSASPGGSTLAEGTATPPRAASPSPVPPRQVDVLSPDDLVAFAQDPNRTGSVVIAQARLDRHALEIQGRRGPACIPQLDQLCVVSLLADASQAIDVDARWVFVPGTNQLEMLPIPMAGGLYAFRIELNRLEYLGPVNNQTIWTVAGLDRASSLVTWPNLFAVDGWLVRTPEDPCAPPPGIDLGYSCGGSFITDEPIDPASTQNRLNPGGVHVQWNAYADFANDPALGPNPSMGPPATAPRHGIYLVTPFELLQTIRGPSNAWSLVGRLEPPMTSASPVPTPTVIPQAEATPLPTGGISRDQAIRLAGGHASITTFTSANAGLFRDLNTDPHIGPGSDIKPDRWVWAVTYTGDITICSPIGTCQSPRPATSTVFLDYYTGDFLGTQTFSPNPN